MASKRNVVVVIDGGGRGSALVHKYSQSPSVKKIVAIPGNDLMQINSKVPVQIFKNLKTTSVGEIVAICKKYKADLVDVAQDNDVEAGLSDRLVEEGFNVVGPSKAAGQIEWDKGWSRDFMKRHKLPIPTYKVFNSQKQGINFISKQKNGRWFIKAAGLADGKGAIPAIDKKEALLAIAQMKKFGKSGETFVAEEWLMGEEFSIFALTDGKTYQIVGSAQDHKRLYDGDTGPNTGGIGCSTPPLVVDKNIYKQADLIIKKTIKGLAKEGIPYKGVLYLGGIVVGKKVFIIEFNARWGSPEAEVLLPGIKNDMFDLGMKIAQGRLKDIKIETDGYARVVVTGSLRPRLSPKERQLFGLDNVIKSGKVLVYGTRVETKDRRFFVSSGRLFHIVGEGRTVIEARQKAYEAISLLYIEGNSLHYRTDIGWRDIQRLHRQRK